MSEHVEAVAKEEKKDEVSEESIQANEQPAAGQDVTPEAEANSASDQPVAAASDTGDDTGDEVTGDATGETSPEAVAADAATPTESAADASQERSLESSADAQPDPQAESQPTEVQTSEAQTSEVQATEVQATEVQATAEATEDDAEIDAETGEKKVVRTLAVGQKVDGVVKRIADFGAFVDIGVGRDGLIHISELSVRRVGKVTDVLQEGQAIEAWIKKLDRERNRISLTLIDPDTKTIRDLEKGDVVQGRVTRLLPYGAFVDIGIGRDALLHVREMAEGFVAKPEDVVQVDEELEARVIDLSRRRSRVDLSLKGLRPEPESAVPHAGQDQGPDDGGEEEVVEDAFENVEVLSPMELAFKKAMEAEGMEVPEPKKGKGKKRVTGRHIQDEIISRTLTDGRG